MSIDDKLGKKRPLINDLATKTGQDAIVDAIENITVPAPEGGATEEGQAIKWLWNRDDSADPADETKLYTLISSTAGHIIRQEDLETGVVMNFRSTATDNATINTNWSNRNTTLTYNYV